MSIVVGSAAYLAATGFFAVTFLRDAQAARDNAERKRTERLNKLRPKAARRLMATTRQISLPTAGRRH